MLLKKALLIFGMLLSSTALADNWECNAYVGWSKIGKFMITYPANANPGTVDWYPTPAVAPTSPLTKGGQAFADRVTGVFEMDFLMTPAATFWRCQPNGYARWTCLELTNTRPETVNLRCSTI